MVDPDPLPSHSQQSQTGQQPHGAPNSQDDGASQWLPPSHALPLLQIKTDFSSDLSQPQPQCHTPSLQALMVDHTSSSAGSPSPVSLVSSPQLAALTDITPLPSPMTRMSPWRAHRSESQSQLQQSSLRSPSRSSSQSRSSQHLRHTDSESPQMLMPSVSRSRIKPYLPRERLEEELADSVGSTDSTEKTETTKAPRDVARSQSRHIRNRSLSEYVPVERGVPVKPRPVAVSGSGLPAGFATSASADSKSSALHREQYRAAQRGIAVTIARPPSPPRSAGGDEGSSGGSSLQESKGSTISELGEIYSVRSVKTQEPRRYRKLRQLGQGTFSQVSLAVRVESGNDNVRMHNAQSSEKLVAVKIIEFGPAGGADEERLEVSLLREVDILKSVNHPSLVQLKAFGSDEKRALLVLDYCPGGDLFDFISSSLNPIAPALIRRIFAELVAAVRHLHQHFIVHRDIKLENVLVNVPASAMAKIDDWRTYDRAVVTLSDLGLSRRIPEPPNSPMLQTRCGSEDYAAPEILLGQPYDGRLTDAWALGVLLYAMLESRLPFDPLPDARGDPAKLRARTAHRIARLEWEWWRYANKDREWDTDKGKNLEGARLCVEGLLKRSTRRKNLDDIARMDWVRDAIDVPDGLRRGDEEAP